MTLITQAECISVQNYVPGKLCASSDLLADIRLDLVRTDIILDRVEDAFEVSEARDPDLAFTVVTSSSVLGASSPEDDPEVSQLGPTSYPS